jgi:putative DNA primase/helicase
VSDDDPFADRDEWLDSMINEANATGDIPTALTEDSLALVFARRHRHELRHCHHHGAWFHWNGVFWRREETQLAFCWARELCREFNTKSNRAIAKVSTARGVEAFCRADRAFAVTSEVWDRNPFLLGTPAGTVDLRSGELRPAEQEDFITRQTAVAPPRPAPSPSCG